MEMEIEDIRKKKMEEIAERVERNTAGGKGWPDAPVTISDANFEETVRKYPNVVVDCWAPWCGPCRMLAPTIDAMAKDQKGEVVFAKLNTDENYSTTSKFRIASIPTILFFKNGQLVDKLIGAAPRPMLEKAVAQVFGSV